MGYVCHNTARHNSDTLGRGWPVTRFIRGLASICTDKGTRSPIASFHPPVPRIRALKLKRARGVEWIRIGNLLFLETVFLLLFFPLLTIFFRSTKLAYELVFKSLINS